MKLPASQEKITFVLVTGFYILYIVNGLPRHMQSLDKLKVQINAHQNSVNEFLEQKLMALKTPIIDVSISSNTAPETHKSENHHKKEDEKENEQVREQARLFEWLNNIIGFGRPQEQHHCSESDEEYDDYHHHGSESSGPYYHDPSHAYSNNIGHFDSHEYGLHHHHGPHMRNVQLEMD